jgi:SAM-dependent methyltransferase
MMKLFLSSTFEDLASYRDAVMDVLAQFGMVFNGMETFGAREQDSLTTCLTQLADSDLVVTLLGTRYGSCPTDSEASYTELEINHALDLGKPLYIYELDVERQPVLARHVETGFGADKLEKLRERLREKFTVARFTTPEHLAMRLASDLAKRIQPQEDSESIARIARRYRETAWDLVAEWYDVWYDGHWQWDEPFQTICAIVGSYAESKRGNLRSLRILDCACGTGNTYSSFAQANYDVWGTDGSREMLIRAKGNCEAKEIRTDRLIMEPINWTDLDGYLKYFDEHSFDLIVNTANSLCHIPTLPNYMGKALTTYKQLLRPGGILLVDTKKYVKSDPIDGVPAYYELRRDPVTKEWVQRVERPDYTDVPGVGRIHIHTRLHHDIDPSFGENVRRTLIVLTIYGEQIPPRVIALPYYPLPADVLIEQMKTAGFTTVVYPAFQDLCLHWKYDVVVGRV